jgi:hypothetical protein
LIFDVAWYNVYETVFHEVLPVTIVMWRIALRKTIVELGNDLRSLRIVADRIGVSVATVEAWVRDKQVPKNNNQQKILSLYHDVFNKGESS